MICAPAAARLRLPSEGRKGGTVGERCEDGADDHPPTGKLGVCVGTVSPRHSRIERALRSDTPFESTQFDTLVAAGY
jgi:hypothetical protein